MPTSFSVSKSTSAKAVSKIAHLIALGLVVRLEETVLHEPVTHLRVVPAAKGGRLGAGVVLIEKLFVLFLLELGSLSVATASQSYSPLT